MASAVPSRGTCTHCAKPGADAPLRYLDLQPICVHELPPHVDTTDINASHGRTLVEFLNGVLAEAFEVDFDGEAWTPLGQYPSGKCIDVIMPPIPGIQQERDISVPCVVNKRANGTTKSAWLARTSEHYNLEIDYSELDALLARDHCGQEADYTPSVFDANELLKWGEEDLKRAVAELKPEWRVETVQMSIYQMCHEMPKALGVSLIQQRVFHILCITAHSTYDAPGEEASRARSQSHTLQLPINIESFRDVRTVMSKSRYRPSTNVYDVTDHLTVEGSVTRRQQKYNGKKFTEGVYASLERLRQAPSSTENRLDSLNRWDMMTKSDARGIITRIAPWSIQKKETLEAVAKDVLYVLEHIGRQRKIQRGDTDVAQ